MIKSQITIPEYGARYTKTFDGNFVNAHLDYGEGVKRVFNRLGMQRSYVGDEYWKRVLHRKSMQQIVPKYQFESNNIKKSNLNQFNGQSNSLYFKCEKYFAFYSKTQNKKNEGFYWREFNNANRMWQTKLNMLVRDIKELKKRKFNEENIDEKSQEWLKSMMQKRPFFDEEKFVFRNRWGNIVQITDVYPITVYDNLDNLIKNVKRQWNDAEFVGVVVKFDNQGNQIK